MAERLVDVGRQLREARQQRGEDLYDVADYLRIKPSYLFALEEGDTSAMPGRTYAMGFLRTYADHLGFDGAEVVRGLKAQAATAEAQLQIREPVADSRRPSLPTIAAAAVLAVVAYGGWHVLQAEGENALARIAALPGDIGQYAASLFDDAAVDAGDAEDIASAPPAAPRTSTASASRDGAAGARLTATDPAATVEPGTAEPATAEPPRTASLESPPTSAVANPAPDVAGQALAADGQPGRSALNEVLAGLVLDAETERAAALERLDSERPDGGTASELLAGLQLSAENDESAAADETAAPVVSDTGRVVLLAREASWIQVQSPARDYVTSRTLEPGDRFVIPDRNDLALWTGNAGGLEIWVDGQNVGVLGRSGAVMRDISLAPDELLAMRR